MAGDKSTVRVTYLGDATALAKASKRAQNSIDGVDRQAQKSSGKIRGSFLSMGAAAKASIAGVVSGSLVVGANRVFDMAASMELMDAKAKTVFGGQISVVQKWAKANANAMGLTSREAVGLSANFADLLIPMGFTRNEAAKMSTSVVGLSGALARWSGGTKTAAEVSEILAKAMLGERDGLKELGISISEADVQNRLLRDGKAKLTGQALEQAKAEATQRLIMEKSTDAQAAYANGSANLAAKKAVLIARVKELRDGAIATLIPMLQRMSEWISKNVVPAVQRLVEQFRNGAGAGGAIRNAVDRIRKAFEDNKPALQDFMATVGQLAKFLLEKVFPIFVKLYSEYLARTFKTIGVLAKGFNMASDAVQKLIDKVAALINKLKSLPGGGIAGQVTDLVGKIPGFASGTKSAPAGWAVVGEDGPELVNFGGGEQVFPSGTVSGGGRGRGGDIYVTLSVGGSVISERDLVRTVRDGLADIIRNRGGDPAVIGA